MLFTVSLQLTMTGHLSTSPSAISLACMLSGLCLLLSSLHFTDCFSPFFPSAALPPSPLQLLLSFLFCNFWRCPSLSVSPKLSLNFLCVTPPSLTVFLQSSFFCSLPHTSSLPLPARSFSYPTPLSLPLVLPPSFPPTPPSLSLIVIEVH